MYSGARPSRSALMAASGPAAEIERAVIDQVRGILCSPEIIVRTWRFARQSLDGISEADVRQALDVSFQ
jgi:hypothetical protein